jgi:hypothetical protein
MLKNSEFNRLVANPQDTSIATTKLLSSGGYKSKLDKHFSDDFYFEDLNLSTLIGLNSRSRETNAIDMSFTIFEPNGCTLIDRLIAVATDIAGAGEDNYLSMPYLIQIDFLGYDTQGTPQKIPDITKIIPINLTEMKIKPDLAGTRYTVRAIPFNHNAMTSSIGAMPTNAEIKAKTVEELFVSSSAPTFGVEGVINKRIEDNRVFEETMQRGTDAQRENATKKNNDSKEQDKQPIPASSLADALNVWQKYLAKEGIIEVADEFNFKFPPEIAKSTVILPQLNPVQDVPTTNEKTKKDPAELALANSIRNGIAAAASSTGVYRIFAGSSITNILSQVVRHSSFIRDQIEIWENKQKQQEAQKIATDAVKKYAVQAAVAGATGGTGSVALELAANSGGVPGVPGAAGGVPGVPGAASGEGRESDQEDSSKTENILKWFKVVPKIELGTFDKIRNMYSKKITYEVSIYDSPNPRYPGAPQGQAEEKDAVKEYNYWYTGKNTDILNVDINFDTAFYTAVSLPASTFANNEVRPVIGTGNDQTGSQSVISSERLLQLRKTGLPFPPVRLPSKQLADMTATTKSAIDKKSIAVEDLADSLMSRNRGDMVVMRLDILGDPDFIKQDGLFGSNDKKESVKTKNGSLLTDYERVIVKFNFTYPEDWTREEGLLRPKKPTVFEGLYAVNKVDSIFERGNFKQNLEMYRLYETDYKPIPKAASTWQGGLDGVGGDKLLKMAAGV